jgi:hypothetical protein
MCRTHDIETLRAGVRAGGTLCTEVGTNLASPPQSPSGSSAIDGEMSKRANGFIRR